MKVNSSKTKFSKLLFNYFFLENSYIDSSFTINDIEKLSDIFIYGRSENIFLKFLKKNHIDIDSEISKTLHENNINRWLKSSFTLHSSQNIFKSLNDNNIKFIPLKGAQLILFYNFDASMRPIRDLDLLVLENDIPKVVEILYELGFFFKNFKTSSKDFGYFVNRKKYDIEPMFNEDGVCIEIHHKIQDNDICSITEEFWENSTQEKFGEYSLLKLKIEHLLLHLIYHSISKQGIDVGIQALFDFYKLVHLPNFDIEKLIALAIKHNLIEELAIFLKIFKKYAGYKIKNDISESLSHVNDSLTEDCLSLFYYNNANNHSIKLYRYKFRDLLFKTFRKETIKSDIFFLGNKLIYIQAFFRRFIRNITRYFPIFIRIIFDKKFRSDNKLTSDILKSINK